MVVAVMDHMGHHPDLLEEGSPSCREEGSRRFPVASERDK